MIEEWGGEAVASTCRVGAHRGACAHQRADAAYRTRAHGHRVSCLVAL